MLLNFLPNGGQRVREGNDMPVLRAFTHLAETGVVPVLLTSFRIAPRRLNMAIDEGAYPDIRPRGRDRERLDPL